MERPQTAFACESSKGGVTLNHEHERLSARKHNFDKLRNTPRSNSLVELNKVGQNVGQPLRRLRLL